MQHLLLAMIHFTNLCHKCCCCYCDDDDVVVVGYLQLLPCHSTTHAIKRCCFLCLCCGGNSVT